MSDEFAQVIQEHLLLKERNAALEQTMPLAYYLDEWELIAPSGVVVATYDGPFDKLVEAADETARTLDIPIAVHRKV